MRLWKKKKKKKPGGGLQALLTVEINTSAIFVIFVLQLNINQIRRTYCYSLKTQFDLFTFQYLKTQKEREKTNKHDMSH